MPAAHPVTVIHGHARNPEVTNTLRTLLESSEIPGTLIIGYPPTVDAVLVSKAGHVTVFHLPATNTEGAYEAQDMAWIRIDSILRRKPEFRHRRESILAVQSITLTTAKGATDDQNDPDHPVATPDTVLNHIRAFHQRPPPAPPADHDTVVDQILWMPSTT